MGINDKIYDRIVSNMTDVRLYENGVQLQNRRILTRHQKNLRVLLSTDIQASVTKEVNRFGKELLVHNTTSLQEFSTAQLDFHTDNINKDVSKFYSTKKPNTKQFLAKVSGPSIKGTNDVRKNIKNIASGELVRIQNKVKLGLAEGLSRKQIVNNVLKTTKLTQHQAATLTRTAITSTQSAALSEVGNSNRELIAGYMFTAVLDSRTSPICSHHNGKLYSIDDKSYQPPLHWNCRSSLVPVVKSKDELLKVRSDKMNLIELAKKQPDQLTGLAKARESYSGWLKRQSVATQEALLGGVEQALLFKTGVLKVAEYVTPTGKGLTISALRRKAALLTSIYPNRHLVKDNNIQSVAATPNRLLNNPKHKTDLRNLLLSDSNDFSQSIALTDFKGTSLVGKQASRRRAANQFDERNFAFDPMTGEIRNTNLYDPNFQLLQERIDFMRASKTLTKEQKNFIEDMAGSLENRISTNQQSVIVENLRVVFERYAKDKKPWENFGSVVRAENRFAVQNVSRLLDVRSRQRSSLFGNYLTEGSPKIQIMGKYYSFDDLQKNMLSDQRYIDNWRAGEGVKLAKKFYLSGRAPARLYFKKLVDKYPTKKKFIAKLRKDNPTWAKAYDLFFKTNKKIPSDSWITKTFASGRETLRSLIDLEFRNIKKTPSTKLLDKTSANVITKAVKLVASGQSTDYDALSINIGKMFSKEFDNIIPWNSHTIKDYHKEGSKLLDMMVDKGLIKVGMRGKVRRGVLDVDTGRASGSWGDTISREVTVVDKNLLKLQEAERRATIASRLGIVSERDRLYVKAGKLNYYNARGKETGRSVITRSASTTFDPKQMDRDFANMLNHTQSVRYTVDKDFVGFMDSVVRFRDPRGNSKYWDSLNEFRHLILKRGEQGYSMLATAKWHMQRAKPFRVNAQIDGRGRVYHTGYLSPTGGETVRPFLNSYRKVDMTPGAVDELKIQLGAMIGPGTEALTQAGRRAIFARAENDLLELGNLLLANTQKDARIRKFLEHPLIRKFEGEEIPKITRLALEYARVHKHVKGDFTNVDLLKKYKTQLMIENDASSSGAQIMGLSTGDRSISINSNVLATPQKNRLYDLVAMDTANDSDFLKIAALRDADIDWEDLAKAAKAQNMVSFYGAGEATQAANIEAKFSKVLSGKGFTVITKQEVTSLSERFSTLIKQSDRIGANSVSLELQAMKKELIELVNNNMPIGRSLLKEALVIHPDVADFATKLTNSGRGLIGPKEFEAVSKIMSKHLALRAPVTKNFTQFWNRAAKEYVRETQSTDIPWVTFDGKALKQTGYRVPTQQRIEFTDPVTGRKVANIYETTATDGKLIGKSSIQRAGIGAGVNGNHMNDATLVRQFHLWGRKQNIETATIHDAFFTNIGHSDLAKDALRNIYADALDGETIRKTLKSMRDNGMTYKTYQRLLREAKFLGLIDPPNKITRREILAPVGTGEDWYGIGP